MPITVAANLKPRMGGDYYLLEDVYLKGGYQIRPSAAERDTINELNLKEGMLVYTLDDHKMWQLGADLKTWNEFVTGGGSSSRTLFEYKSGVIFGGAVEDFDIDMTSSTAMLLELSVSAPCVIEIHSTPFRKDTNPFTFIASDSHLEDDGSTIMSDGTVEYGRRYSILANLESPPTKSAYGRIVNSSSSETQVSVSLVLLPQ